jgi:hypothetical protein
MGFDRPVARSGVARAATQPPGVIHSLVGSEVAP